MPLGATALAHTPVISNLAAYKAWNTASRAGSSGNLSSSRDTQATSLGVTLPAAGLRLMQSSTMVPVGTSGAVLSPFPQAGAQPGPALCSPCSSAAVVLSSTPGGPCRIRSVTSVAQEPTGSMVTWHGGPRSRSSGRWSRTSTTASSRAASALMGNKGKGHPWQSLGNPCVPFLP